MSASTEWVESFFSGTFVELWLRAMPEQQTRAEVDFLEKALRLPPQAKVLDVACGGGRHAHELAARGHRVSGVDASPEFLAAARAKAAERGLDITWERRAMQDIAWQGEFDGAFCMGNSLGGLDDDGHAAAFKAIARALKPGARFVVDNGAIAECILPTLKERFWMPAGDVLFLIHNCYDHFHGRLVMEFTLIRGGREEKKYGFQQVYTYREFCRLLTQAGFADFEGYGSVGGEPFRLGSHNLVLVARKADGG